jgi:hypothetical protein
MHGRKPQARQGWRRKRRHLRDWIDSVIEVTESVGGETGLTVVVRRRERDATIWSQGIECQ